MDGYFFKMHPEGYSYRLLIATFPRIKIVATAFVDGYGCKRTTAEWLPQNILKQSVLKLEMG